MYVCINSSFSKIVFLIMYKKINKNTYNVHFLIGVQEVCMDKPITPGLVPWYQEDGGRGRTHVL